jgi:hypothetical protein
VSTRRPRHQPSALFAITLIFCACSVATSSLAAAKTARLTGTSSTKSTQSGPSVYYVSNLGNDSWSGKLPAPNATGTDGPFATLTKARDAIRALHPSGALAYPATVYVRGGTYSLAQPLLFSPQDSGNSSAPVTYAAYDGEQPIISGGTAITGWKQYSGTALPSSLAGQIWVAPTPTGLTFRQLFVNGYRRTRARTPNAGSFRYVDGVTTTYPNSAQFKFHPGDVSAQWAQAGTVETVVLRSWVDSRLTISAVDTSSSIVSLNGSFPAFGAEQNPRYWVENSLDALDVPGEWYLDAKTSLLYYYPFPGEDVTKANVIAPRLQQLVQFQGNASTSQYVSYIKLVGLTFSFADWAFPNSLLKAQGSVDVPGTIFGSGVHSLTVQHCRFLHFGGYALEFNQGSRGVNLVGNEMGDLGTGGVKIGDTQVPSNSNLLTSDNFVTDNVIHDIGEVFPSGVGVWIGQSANNDVAHNEIYDTYYSAISVGWTWGFGTSAASNNIVEYNDVHDVGRGMLSDLGCIYTLGVQPGTVERNNVCHDVSRYAYGGFGLQMDEGSSQIVAENNLVYRTEDAGFTSSSLADSLTIRNNIFALADTAELIKGPGATTHTFTFTKNIVYWTQGVLLANWPQDWSDGSFSFDSNLYFPGGDCSTTAGQGFCSWFAQWKATGQDANSAIGDPLFTNPSQDDFSLQAGSPASGIGFQTIDLSTVGPRAGF